MKQGSGPSDNFVFVFQFRLLLCFIASGLGLYIGRIRGDRGMANLGSDAPCQVLQSRKLILGSLKLRRMRIRENEF